MTWKISLSVDRKMPFNEQPVRLNEPLALGLIRARALIPTVPGFAAIFIHVDFFQGGSASIF